MSTTLADRPMLEAADVTSTASDPERWLIPTAVCATTSIVIGAVWDISWHMTVGRDTLWTLPHLLEQFGAAVAGTVCGAYVLWLTFRAPAHLRQRTVRFWGFQGPLGAWVIIWGALAMIVSVPFDNWWHNAYGLDVQILSPPHSVLMLGVLGIQIGTMLFTVAAKNRATVDSTTEKFHARSFTYATGVLLLMSSLAVYEIIGYPNSWHSGEFYKVSGGLFTIILAFVARAAGRRWAATTAAATYMGIMLVTIWILQLVPAEPKLAPIYNHVTHMVPLAFPLVLLAPAIAIDLIQERMANANKWQTAAFFGIAFVVTMLLVHWPFAEFMLTPHARNYVFAADQWPYMYRLGPWRYIYWRMDVDAAGTWAPRLFIKQLGFATVIAIISARAGIAVGDFTRRIMR